MNDKADKAVEYQRGLDLGFQRRASENWWQRTKEEQREWWTMQNASAELSSLPRNPDKRA